MSKRKKKKRTNKINLSSGLWFNTEDFGYIGVKKKLIKPPKPIIRYGKEKNENGDVELVETATFPRFEKGAKENEHWTAKHIVECFENSGLSAEDIYVDDEKAEAKFQGLMKAIITILEDTPLGSYRRGYMDINRVPVDKDLVWKYTVEGLREDGSEILEEFPYLEKTHVIDEMVLNDNDLRVPRIFPRIYEELYLGEKYYELYAKTDADRVKMSKFKDKLNHYPVPIFDEKGQPVMDGDGKQMVEYQEVMLVYDGFCLQSGSSNEYHALIWPETIQTKKQEKFILIMKLTKGPIEYENAMPVPKPGEVPVTTLQRQKPLIMEEFASSLANIKAKAAA